MYVHTVSLGRYTNVLLAQLEKWQLRPSTVLCVSVSYLPSFTRHVDTLGVVFYDAVRYKGCGMFVASSRFFTSACSQGRNGKWPLIFYLLALL